MKLKTLKDFESFPSKIDLKAEAIKWVKEGPVDKKTIGFILHFFDITEEDLK